MAQAQGSLARLSFVEEVTYGTTPGSPAMKLLKAAVYGESLDAELEEIKSNAINAVRAVDTMRTGNIDVKGAIPFELPIRGLSTILKHVMGGKTTTGSNPYTHVLKRAALPVGLAIEKGFTDIAQYFVYNGCKIDKLNLKVTPAGLATGTLDIVGQKPSQSTSTLGSPTAVVHAPYAEFEAVALEAASSITLVNFNLSVTNNLDPQKVIGSRYINQCTDGKGECTGDITFLFQDAAIYAKWLAETASTLRVTFTSGTFSIDFYMPAIKYIGSGTPPISTEKGIVMTQKFRATYDSGSASDIVITIISDEATI